MARNISSRMNFLIKFGLLPAEAWDFVIPHGPRFTATTREYAMAGVVRDIAKNIPDKSMQKKLLAAGKSMVEFSSKGLINAWEEGDDICPPWGPPLPWPGPVPDPEPIPWLTARPETISDYSNALKLIAGMSKLPSVSKQLTEVASVLSRQEISFPAVEHN